MSEKSTEKSQLDVSSVINHFDKWHLVMLNLQATKSALEEQVKAVHKENKDLQQKNSKLQKELSEMQAMISSVGRQLHHVCNMEDEVKTLKAEVKMKNAAVADLHKEMEEQKTSQKTQLEELEETRVTELKIAVEETRKQGADQAEQLKKEIANRDQTIQGLQGELEKAAADTRAEIVRITMEYESKINKLQRQKSQNVTTQSSMATQEIFRKKLQFIKAESEKEVSELKRTVAELQQKLTNLQREPTKLSLSMGKKRRY